MGELTGLRVSAGIFPPLISLHYFASFERLLRDLVIFRSVADNGALPQALQVSCERAAAQGMRRRPRRARRFLLGVGCADLRDAVSSRVSCGNPRPYRQRPGGDPLIPIARGLKCVCRRVPICGKFLAGHLVTGR